MPRTTEEAVALLAEVDELIDLSPFIETASAFVEEVCATALDSDGNDYYDATRLELIERWLAAHFYKIRDPQVENEAASGISQKNATKVELGFNLTHWGQMALRLDTYGGLAALEETTKAGAGRPTFGILWLGTPQE